MKNISFYIIGLLFLFLPQFIHAQTTDTDVNSFLDKAEKELYTNPQQAAYYALIPQHFSLTLFIIS